MKDEQTHIGTAACFVGELFEGGPIRGFTVNSSVSRPSSIWGGGIHNGCPHLGEEGGLAVSEHTIQCGLCKRQLFPPSLFLKSIKFMKILRLKIAEI